ncbi:(R)-mandelonitrile lyase-like [Musa acuminata AAA Group]|uniref:(R)-mandelonitrile lyase-like n=1 Tax=Musa acuminata AAA Group TaxID=214697 RepID=UPI0008A0C52B|nr:PREDICTED: (R)-mandelonitrile lyase-like isoform X1 [Musa acuminata subsp. malaccensis]
MGRKPSLPIAALLLFLSLPSLQGMPRLQSPWLVFRSHRWFLGFLIDPIVVSPLAGYAGFTCDATVFPKEAEYDYIIVGGGTAGCPLAATLSESHRVLVLERGGAPGEFPSLAGQDGFLRTLVDTDARDSPAQPFTSDEGVPNARGRVLGGSSAINAGFYSRAHPSFFDGGDAGGTVAAWNIGLVNESFEWVEREVAFRPVLRSWQAAVRDGLLEAGATPYNGFTVEHVVGTKIGAATFDSHGRRHSAADLLRFANPTNIKVAIRATVHRILLNPVLPGSSGRSRPKDQVMAAGVVYRDGMGRHHRAKTRPGGEVILSAGALGSPQLLLLSGIGPRPYLSAWGIPVALHHPSVGRHMYDNPRNSISFIPAVPVDNSLIQVVGIPGADASFVEAVSNIVTFHSPAPSVFLHQSASPLFVTVATLMEKVPGPASEGSLRLASLDARDNPLVRFNYFSRPEDLARCVAGVRRLGDVLYGRSMKEFRAGATGLRGGRAGRRDTRFVGPALPANMSDDAAVAAFCRRTVSTLWHYHGGCASGKVVDGDFRVMGAAALRVVDGSTFRVSPGTNPQATVMMMGRYVGLKMLQEREE